jgi:membrane dipeptidase
MAPAANVRDLENNRNAGKISAFLTIENGFLVRGDLNNLKKIYDMGVRLLTLTWNDANCFGQCHSKKPEEMQQGLTEFGKEAVEYMNTLGILVDVSHLSDGGFYDVAAISQKPFVASHSDCRALAPATRNLTDDMIRILADKGGVAGINFAPEFLDADTKNPVSSIEAMCDHIMHFIEKGGIECVGIGTDFDGISGTLEIEDCTGMPRLFDALHKRGLSDDAIEKIAYRNVMRVIRDVM